MELASLIIRLLISVSTLVYLIHVAFLLYNFKRHLQVHDDYLQLSLRIMNCDTRDEWKLLMHEGVDFEVRYSRLTVRAHVLAAYVSLLKEALARKLISLNQDTQVVQQVPLPDNPTN